ncbi:mitochondrial distribution and morphology protein [Acrasis kona]|uniref:Mitochondrial distribution and morphology protein n=1 Tax=Acrasis kona TaxID=1008807 RepID=A0AAW2YX57_9EUKA
MFRVDWEGFANKDFPQHILESLNETIRDRFKNDKTFSDNLSHLVVQSLTFGSTPPIFKLINVCEAPEEHAFEARRMKDKELQRIQMSAMDDKTVPVHIIPKFVNKGTKHPKSVHTPLLDDSDRHSVLSGHSDDFMASIIKRQIDERHGLRSVKSPITTPKTFMPVGHSNIDLSSLEKPISATKLCSVGTIFKKKLVRKEENADDSDDSDDDDSWKVVQTKRREDWWKDRCSKTKRGDDLEHNAKQDEKQDKKRKKKEKKEIKTKSKEGKTLTEAEIEEIKAKHAQEEKEEQAKKMTDLLGYILGDGVKITMKVMYDGNASLQLSTEVLVNVPVPRFLTLPINVTISHLSIDGDFTVIYRPNSKHEAVAYFEPSNSPGELFSDSKGPIKDLSMNVLIGAPLVYDNKFPGENVVYNDRGKIEGLVTDLIQYFAKEQIVYPNVQKYNK